MNNKDTILEHYGVKGMKWGVRKDKSSSAPKGEKEPKKKTRVGKAISSSKREAMLLKDFKNSDKMSDAELKSKTDRMRKENDLKRLTEPGALRTRKKLKKRDEYFEREKLSDKELSDRISRLQLEDNLKKQVKSANKTHIKLANSVIKNVSEDALNKYTDEKGNNFSATGKPEYDVVLEALLKQTSKKPVIK